MCLWYFLCKKINSVISFYLCGFFFMTFCNNLFLQFLKEDTDGCLRVCRSTNVLQCETTVCGSSTAVLTRLPQAAEAPVSCTLCPGGGALSHPGGTPSAVWVDLAPPPERGCSHTPQSPQAPPPLLKAAVNREWKTIYKLISIRFFFKRVWG